MGLEPKNATSQTFMNIVIWKKVDLYVHTPKL